MRVLSKEEREAEFKKKAVEATRKANTAAKPSNKPNALAQIRKHLHKLGYIITDDAALAQVIGDSKTLKHDQIALLSEKGIISLNEAELEAPAPELTEPHSTTIPFVNDVLNPTFENAYTDSFASGQPHLTQNEELKPAPKITVFSISEALNEPAPVKTQQLPTPSPKPRKVSVSVNEFPQDQPATVTPNEIVITPQKAEERIEEIIFRRENKQTKPEEITEKPGTQKIAPQEKNTSDIEAKEPEWVKGYPESLKKYCQTSVDKKTGQPRREIKEVRVEKDDHNQPIKVEVEVKPLSPIARKRGDVGATYTIQKNANPEKLDITVKSAEPGKPLNYDYFYALVKAARDNGADTIEFNNIRTPEFRDKLLAAALQFKMKLKNPPGAIDMSAQHLDTIPPGCRQYLEKHNEAVKKALQKQGKEIIPPQGQKFGEGPRAEERTHAEKVYIESLQEEEKLKRAERHMREQEKRANSPSTADYDQNPARGNRDPSDRRPRQNNNRGNYNQQRPQRISKDR